MSRTFLRILPFAALALLLGRPAPALAQLRHMGEVLRNADGEVFDFHPDGAWRVLARRVAAYRRLLLAQGNYGALNAALAAPSTMPAPAVVSGVRRVPAILFQFSDSSTAPTAGFTQANYQEILFSATAPSGKPYSIRSFYNEMSNGMLDLQGSVVDWVTLANPESTYTYGTKCSGANPYGPSYINCNGIWGAAVSAMRAGLTEALTQADAMVDFAQYDNDGPDGTPNSGDDDGYVDMVIFIHSEMDGACLSPTNGHLWSHRGGKGGADLYVTTDARSGGGFIRVRDYTVQAGLGGTLGCSASQIAPIGTAAHETGHAFGLPDLYDTQQGSEGIGNWGLMGSGNSASHQSPARMEAWSLNELGWVTVVPLTNDTTVTFGPVPTADTAFLVRVPSTNPRGEYYLLENRQAVQADTGLIRTVCGRSGLSYLTSCRGGLAIWHVDSQKVALGRLTNSVNNATTVNGAPVRGLVLAQADDRGNLDQTPGPPGNRGDAGDLWPGFGTGTPKTRYSFNSSPSAHKNADTTQFVGFEIDSIEQVVANGEMKFRLRFGGLTIVRAADTLAKVKVEGVPYGRFADILSDGQMYQIAMDSAQTTAGGRTQFLWQSWSDAGARAHTITGSFAGDSISAAIGTKFRLLAATNGSGSVASSPSVNHAAGAFIDQNAMMTLTATPGAGAVFERWIGDTNTTANPLTLTMTKPYDVTANFSALVAVTSAAPGDGVMGKPYSHNFTASGGTGTYAWSVAPGSALPAGTALSAVGALTGTLQTSGSAGFTIRLTSGVQTLDTPVTITITEPTLALNNVLGGLLGTGGTLSADDRTYLDLIGNNSNSYDVGDFLAWVEKTGASPAPAVMSRLLGGEGEESK